MTISPYPNETLRKQLLAYGLPEEKHHLTGMKAVLAAHFDFSQIYHLQDPDEIAEILVYLTKKKLLKIRKTDNPGPA